VHSGGAAVVVGAELCLRVQRPAILSSHWLDSCSGHS